MQRGDYRSASSPDSRSDRMHERGDASRIHLVSRTNLRPVVRRGSSGVSGAVSPAERDADMQTGFSAGRDFAFSSAGFGPKRLGV